MTFEIIYQDNDIIVANKPHGLLSQPDEKGSDNLLDLLKEETASEIYPVHRLDKATKGLIVYAKNKSAAASLSKQIGDNTFEKTYIAKIHGKLPEKEGTMEDLLFFDRRKNKSFAVKRERKGVKKAKLNFKVLFENESYTEAEVKLLTGRTHQIRVQFASRGCPLLGDRRYGAKDEEKNLALYSVKLSFLNKNGERMDFTLSP